MPHKGLKQMLCFLCIALSARMKNFQSGGLCLDEDSFDMTVRIGSQKFKCLRCILSNRSSFFRNLCRSTKHKKYFLGLEEEEYPKHMYIAIDDFPGAGAAFEMILNFCYGKRVLVSADKNFLYLHHAAMYLGMKNSSKSEGDNLEKQCESFWEDHILCSWKAILDILCILKEGNLVLPKYQVDLYSQKCLEGLGPAMKNMNYRDLPECIYKLVMVAKDHLMLVLDSGTNWPQCKTHKVIISFALAAQMLGSNVTCVTDKFGLIAKSLLQANLHEEEDSGNLPCLQSFMALKDAQPITHMLILLDAFSDLVYKGKFESIAKEVENIKVACLEILVAEDLGISSPEAALQFIGSLFTQKESRTLEENGHMLTLSYLDLCKKECSPLPFELFFAFAKTLSVLGKDSHDALYDEILSYSQEVNISEEEKRCLGTLVNSAILSSNRLEQVLAINFPVSLREYVCSLRREIASLKDHSRKRRRAKQRNSKDHMVMELDADSESEVHERVFCLQNDKEVGYARKMKRLESSCSSFYISVLTVNGVCISFPIKASDAMSQIKRKLVQEMSRNSVKVPCCPWFLTYHGKTMGNSNSTAQENGIEMHSLLQIGLAFFK